MQGLYHQQLFRVQGFIAGLLVSCMQLQSAMSASEPWLSGLARGAAMLEIRGSLKDSFSSPGLL